MNERGLSRAGLWWAVGLFVVVALVGVAVRPALFRDETRYLAVAWEMWLRRDWLVPHINGETYSHKPPMLFWLMNAGWRVLGVSEWWARAVGPLCAVACIGLTWRLTRLLWPAGGGAGVGAGVGARAWMAAVLLATSAGWMLFGSLTMFDAPLTLCVLAALIGVVKARRGALVPGLVLAGLAMGVGVLTKGPVVFLHVVPAMVLAPWWDVGRGAGGAEGRAIGRVGAGRWSVGVLAAVVLGAGVALLWALPAAKAGGEKFANEILWGQSAGRMVNSFRHARPWWFFIPIVPALLFPWSLWPPVWRAVGRLGAVWHDAGVRFIVSWLVPAFVVFSLISGKQAHYLLPMLAGSCVLLARLLPLESVEREERGDHRPIAITLLVCGVGLVVFPVLVNGSAGFASMIGAQPWAYEHHAVASGVLIGLGVLLLAWDVRTVGRRLAVVAAVSAAVMCVGQWDAMRIARPFLDLRPMSEVLSRLEKQGRPIAHLGQYHGQFHFFARLERPFALSWDNRVAAWCRENPTGVVVGTYDRWPVPAVPEQAVGEPIFSQALGSQRVVAWGADQVLAGLAALNERGAERSRLLPTGEEPGGGADGERVGDRGGASVPSAADEE